MGRGMEEREGGRRRERERHRKRNKYTEWAEGRGETQGGGHGARGAERQEGRQRHAQGCEETHPQTRQGDAGRRRGRVGRAWRLGDTPPTILGVGRGSLLGPAPPNPSCPAWNRGGSLGGGCMRVSLCVPAWGLPSLQEPCSSSLGPPPS